MLLWSINFVKQTPGTLRASVQRSARDMHQLGQHNLRAGVLQASKKASRTWFVGQEKAWKIQVTFGQLTIISLLSAAGTLLKSVAMLLLQGQLSYVQPEILDSLCFKILAVVQS